MRLFGLIGEKLGHSLSEPIHQRLFELLQIPAAYKLMEIPRERVSGVVDAIRLLSLDGINITIPYKEALLPQLDEIDASAKPLGAVNTVKNDGGKLTGYNTDVHGIKAMLGFHGIDPKGGAAVILGSGGAAKAAMQALFELGVQEIFVVSRSPEGKASPVPNARFISYEELHDVSGALLLNATPVGMWPHGDACPVSEDIVARFSAIADTIYNPWETQLLAMARRQNKPCCNGLYMLVAQAMRAEEIFLDRAIPAEITLTIYRELSQRLNP